jgi:hypothetical protein
MGGLMKMKIHETQATNESHQVTNNEIQSFNNVTDHYHNIMGVPTKPVDLNSMPKPIRWFGYFFYTVIGVGAIAFIIGVIMQK